MVKKEKGDETLERGTVLKLGFWQTKADRQKKAMALLAIVAIMAIIISIWTFFFRHNVSLIYQSEDKEKEESRQEADKLEEIKDRLEGAFDDFSKNFDEAKEKRIERQRAVREEAEAAAKKALEREEDLKEGQEE